MNRDQILSFLDKEIAKLTQARTVLADPTAQTSHSRKPMQVTGPRRHRLSAEGRQRISDAVRRRWEKQRQAA